MKQAIISSLMMIAVAVFPAVGRDRSGIGRVAHWASDCLDYKADVRANGTIVFTATSEGEELAFRLTPRPNKDNEYALTGVPGGDTFNPFEGVARAKHVDKEGQNLLCLFDKKGRLCAVLSPLEYENGSEEAQHKWMRQLAGEYSSGYDEPLVINQDATMRFGAIDLTYRPVTFNGMVTGVVDIAGGTRLEGCWETEFTPDGLKLHRVRIDEFERAERTGEEEVFAWTRTDKPRFGYASQILLNHECFRRHDKSLLRLIRNEILCHHGYMPVSTDLVEYLEGKEWYSPRPSNDGVFEELSLVESLNIELIKAAESQEDLD